MKHKIEMYKLKEIKREKLEQVRSIQREIAKIEASINNHEKLYLLNNKYSDESAEIIMGYSKDNIRGIIKFLMSALIDGKIDSAYKKAYKNIDLDELLNDENFFDFVIVHIGSATIKDLKKRFDKVEVHDGKEFIKRVDRSGYVNNDSIKNRLYKKFNKGAIINEARRISMEKKNGK